jgi:hypothetical protein
MQNQFAFFSNDWWIDYFFFIELSEKLSIDQYQAQNFILIPVSNPKSICHAITLSQGNILFLLF